MANWDETTGVLLQRRPRGLSLRLAVAIGATFVVLPVLVVATWLSTSQLIDDARGVERTRDARRELEAILSGLAQAESGERGYLLTVHPAYLEPFRAALADLPRRLLRVEALVSGRPAVETRCRSLRALVARRSAEMSRAVVLFDEGDRDAAIAIVASESGLKTAAEIRTLVGEMSAEERRLLWSHEGRTLDTARRLVGTLGAAAALLFLLLFVIWRLIRKDLANRDRFEAALVGREKRIRRLIDSNVVGVVFSDPDGIVEANDEFLSMVGIDRALWRPRAHRLFAFTAPEFRALDEKCAAELRGTGTSRPFQKELLRPDGSRVPVLFGVAAVETDAEKPLWTSFVVDLTEMKRLESERNRLYEEARDAVKARDAFLSVAGHEIRTPLSALNLQLFQLSRHLLVLGNERALALARRSEKQVARLVRLSDRLLDVSRITAGALHLDLEEVDLALLVREIADRFEDSAGRAGCVLTVRAPESLVGFWDRSRLDQVITNLLSNALKFGAGKPVDLGLRLAGEAALLTVNDMGIGIHADDQARIFERFERAVAREAYRGMGLGLWIVREIVSAHDGKLTVQSRPGAGATFTVTFPRRMGTEEAVE